MSDNEEDSPVYCSQCPSKPPISNLDKAQTCTNCCAVFHEKCFPRHTRRDGSSRCLQQTSSGATSQQPPAMSLDYLAVLIGNLDCKMERVSSGIANIRTDISDINETLSKFDSKLTGTISQMNKIEKKVTDNVERITLIETNNNNTLNELEDRRSRSGNVIFYNLSEQIVSNIDDMTAVSQLVAKSCPVTRILAVRRMGKPVNSKPRPLVATFQSSQDVVFYLRNRVSLPPGVSISADRTSSQRQELKDMRNSIHRHNTENPNDLKTIKYRNGVPTIVSDPHSSESLN